jgi:hypothetical protein
MTEPAGSVSLAQDRLRDTLAASTAFQTWVGAANATAAAARVYLDDLPEPAGQEDYTRAELEAYRPMAIIETDEEGFTYEHGATGDSFEFDVSGKLRLCLEQSVSEALANDNAELLLQFRNSYGQILDDLCDLAGTPGYLGIVRMRTYGPFRMHPDRIPRQGDAVWVWVVIEWVG